MSNVNSRSPKSKTLAPALRAHLPWRAVPGSTSAGVQNQKSQACYCYIVECSDGSFYTGWTTNLEKRVAAHNAGRGSRYTRLRRPVKLVYFENLPNRSEAMRREAQIKRMKRAAKLARISKFKISNAAEAP